MRFGKKAIRFIGYPLILSMAIMALLFTGYKLSVENISMEEVDVVYLNEIVKNIEAKLGKNELQNYLENKKLKLIAIDDENYNSKIFEEIKNEGIILDIRSNGEIVYKVVVSQELSRFDQLNSRLMSYYITIGVLVMMILFCSYLKIYNVVLKPFEELENFARDISSGNLDIPIAMDKKNYFGAFTESFDLMRTELKRAREGEYRANISKKELIANLSHDIKTPIATIKALCEILEIKLKESKEVEKIKVIETKANVVNNLITDMFTSTMDELEHLKVTTTEESSLIITDIFKSCDYLSLIKEENTIPECLITCDKLRLEQVIANIINNSYKYANTDIYISYKIIDNTFSLLIKDKGPGVKEDEIPLLFEKYYRGKDSKDKPGTGLGLYISKMFIDSMKGEIEAYIEEGLVINIRLKLV